MTETCEDCGRKFAVTEEQWLDSHDRDGYPNGPLCGVAVDMGPNECRIHTIKRLKARVLHLEGQLENYDTTDAENHAVHTLIDKFNRILDEREQVGWFGSAKLQAFAQRILKLAVANWETRNHD